MKKTPDPLRLGEDGATPERLAAALRQARSGPDARSIGRLSSALGVVAPLAPPVVPPPSSLAAPAAAATGGSSLGIIALAGAVAVGAGGGAIALSSSGTPNVAPVASVTMPVAPRAPAPVATTPVIAEPVPSAENEAAPPPITPPRRRPAEAPPAAPEVPSAVPVAEPAPVASAPVAPEEPAPPSDAASRLREEALLVRNAERLLGSDPRGALRLTEERRRRFPGGALDQEAEVVAIDALLRLGRREAATARARAFEASHPGSLHARRIRTLVGPNP